MFTCFSIYNQEFNILKEILITKPVLKHFNKQDPIILLVDSLKARLGAVLLQDSSGICIKNFKTLNETQKG